MVESWNSAQCWPCPARGHPNHTGFMVPRDSRVLCASPEKMSVLGFVTARLGVLWSGLFWFLMGKMTFPPTSDYNFFLIFCFLLRKYKPHIILNQTDPN